MTRRYLLVGEQFDVTPGRRATYVRGFHVCSCDDDLR
jgi:hypothetical protein